MKFCNTVQYEQLIEDQYALGRLPMPHAAPLRGLNAPLRTLRQARLEVSLARATAYVLSR